jgi:hypothetical protein
MQGHVPQTVIPLNDDAWQESGEYRYGIDLFNHGFYWEAHEAWESLWHAAGRRGPIGLWLKALIKLAAAAVKLREGNPRGVVRHARRSQELLQELRSSAELELSESDLSTGSGAPPCFCGVRISDIKQIAAAMATEAEQGLSPNPNRVLDRWLILSKQP